MEYLEAIPDRYVKNKNKIIESIKTQQAMQQQAMAAQQQEPLQMIQAPMM